MSGQDDVNGERKPARRAEYNSSGSTYVLSGGLGKRAGPLLFMPLGLSLVISVKFTLEMCVAARNREIFTKIP